MGIYKCVMCQKSYGPLLADPFKMEIGIKTRDGSYACSERCARDWNHHLLNSGGNSNSNQANNTRNSNQSNSANNSNQSGNEKKSKSAEEIAAEERQRKEVDESDARFFDGIKKFFMRGKNKAAKELHSKLEEIESKIRIAISKGDIDKAGDLIRQLKHDSSFFVPKTNITYSKYWADKREECLNRI